MTLYLIGAGVAVVALFVLAAFRRGLIDGRAVRKLSNSKRAAEAWRLTDTDEIKPLKVCGATDADAGRRDRQPGADPEPKTPGRSASPANPIPMVQREIEVRALLDAAFATGRDHPEQCPLFIHAHQADARGQEIRN